MAALTVAGAMLSASAPGRPISRTLEKRPRVTSWSRVTSSPPVKVAPAIGAISSRKARSDSAARAFSRPSDKGFRKGMAWAAISTSWARLSEKWTASTVPPNIAAMRAASPNDIAASGPPSEIARIDLYMPRSPASLS